MLAVSVEDRIEVEIGARKVGLAGGIYAYVGSARGPGGLRARISRHLRKRKKERWHVDRILSSPRAEVAAVVYAETDEMVECLVVERLLEAGFAAPARGLGSSDCRKCPAHFLKAPLGVAEFIRAAIEALASLHLEPKVHVCPRNSFQRH